MGEELIGSRLPLVLHDDFGIETSQVTRIQAGTASDNFVVTTTIGSRWFVKVYRTPADAPEATAAIALAEFAREGGTPVPVLRRTRRGEALAQGHGLIASVWEFVEDAETAEGGLSGSRWRSAGSTIGRLHRQLATHPAARPTSRSPAELFDLATTTARYDRLIQDYRQLEIADDDDVRSWVGEALIERRALLPQVMRLLRQLPGLTVQILHGDLAAPNVMLRGAQVAAVVDFQPPSPQFLAWEIARLACDPRTLVTNPRWRDELPDFLGAYGETNPGATPDDLAAVLTVGCAYMLASTYPLSALLRRPVTVDDSLRIYGRQRHLAALAMLAAIT